MISVKVMSVISAGALFLGTMTTSAFADSQISGNGALSRNTITNNQQMRTDVSQSNNTNFNNNVSVNGNTGGNNASFNTGGSTSITTGDTSASVDIENTAGQNIANVGSLNCGCTGTSTAVISGNGAFSRNQITDRSGNSLRVNQNNTTRINNRVNVNGNTGRNSSSFNTGGNNKWNWNNGSGSTSINTGSTNADVMLQNMAGSNQLGN